MLRKKSNFWRVKAFVMWGNFVALMCFLGLVLMQTLMQTLRILCLYRADSCTKKVVINSSDFFCVPFSKKKYLFNIGFFRILLFFAKTSLICIVCTMYCNFLNTVKKLHRKELENIASLKHLIIKKTGIAHPYLPPCSVPK